MFPLSNRDYPALKFSAETWLCLGLCVYSLLCYLIVCCGGYGDAISADITGVAYKTYWNKPNWYFFPFFFLIMILLLRLAGSRFLNAWRGLAETGVLKQAGRTPDAQALDNLIARIQRIRWVYCLSISMLIAGGLSYCVDMKEIRGVYYHTSTFQQQMNYACKEPDFFSKWLFDEWKSLESNKRGKTACEKEDVAGGKAKDGDKKEKWMADNKLSSLKKNISPPGDQQFILWALYFEQFAIASLALWVFSQLIMYAVLFGRFNSWRYAKDNGFLIELNFQSPMNEFGLEHWNQALNNMYWALSIGLIIPILSRHSQPDPNSPDDGQWILRVGICALLLLPMIANILSRQAHIPKVWSELKKGNSDDAELFHQQKLWPLDRNWASKLGIIVAFTLASLFLGIELKSIMKF